MRGNPDALRAIGWGGLIGGILDISDALIFYGLHGVPPERLLQGIARGLLGTRARRLGDSDTGPCPAFSDRVYGSGGLLHREPALTDVAGTAGMERLTVRHLRLPVYEHSCRAAIGDSSQPHGHAPVEYCECECCAGPDPVYRFADRLRGEPRNRISTYLESAKFSLTKCISRIQTYSSSPADPVPAKPLFCRNLQSSVSHARRKSPGKLFRNKCRPAELRSPGPTAKLIQV
jgi:hypothetical protein